VRAKAMETFLLLFPVRSQDPVSISGQPKITDTFQPMAKSVGHEIESNIDNHNLISY